MMGRTSRRRRRRRQCTEFNLNHDEDVINLRRWMCERCNWRNDTALYLKDFPITGRGVASKKNLKINDLLIEIPYDLMISCSVVESSQIGSMITRPLRIHELLAVFLVLEKQKVNSSWKHYIKSLPECCPTLPWLWWPQYESHQLPSTLYERVRICKSDFEASWTRVRESMKMDCVISREQYVWAYVMVNTRAVYVDPAVVRCKSNAGSLTAILSDDPSMALCPYLDMFNHSYTANTHAVLDGSTLMFKLRTLTGYKRHEQIFISYGPHNNERLLCEYGFFIPNNINDVFTIEFTALKNYLTFNEKQYKYVQDKGLTVELYLINSDDLSFNLKGLLYVALHGSEEKLWNLIIYNQNYDECDVKAMKQIVMKVLKDMDDFECSGQDDSLLSDYLKYVNSVKRSLIV